MGNNNTDEALIALHPDLTEVELEILKAKIKIIIYGTKENIKALDHPVSEAAQVKVLEEEDQMQTCVIGDAAIDKRRTERQMRAKQDKYKAYERAWCKHCDASMYDPTICYECRVRKYGRKCSMCSNTLEYNDSKMVGCMLEECFNYNKWID